MDSAKRYVTVGDAKVPVNEEEWRVARLPRDTPVEWSGRKREPAAGVGVLLYSWFYDGVIAEIDSGGKRVTLCPGWDGSKIRVLAATSRLNQPMTNGDGI